MTYLVGEGKVRLKGFSHLIVATTILVYIIKRLYEDTRYAKEGSVYV